MKKIRRKRTLLICIMLLIMSTTTMTSYAYFNSKVNMESLLGVNSNSTQLEINNGKIDMNFENSSEWISSQNPNNIVTKQSDGSYLYKVTNTKESPKLEYGPVVLSSGETNLTKNVDLSVNFNMNSDEITTIGPEEVPGFEVLVGDIDNFGFGANSPYSGNLGTWHNMDVYPDEYDAPGTDRRMVVSGFYNYVMALNGEENSESLSQKWKSGALQSEQYSKDGLGKDQQNADRNWIQEYNAGRAYYGFKSNKEVTIGEVKFPYGYPVTFEGYTDRALRGAQNNAKSDGTTEDAADCIVDGKNWRYLQKVEPLTFKYTLGEGKINSAVFQVYFDDLQSGDSVNSYDKVFILNSITDPSKNYTVGVSDPFKLNRFVVESMSRYKAYIQVANSASTRVEVPEISKIINSFNQSGPCGNMVTFSLPKRLLHYVKDAAGLDKGLQLIVDDTRAGTSGDTYCIDFAKLTVNAPVDSDKKIKISGTVKDFGTGKIITNCNGKVTSSDGSEATIAADGRYSIEVCAGVVYLTFNIDGYEQTDKSFGNITEEQNNVEVELKPFSQSSEITVQLKIAQLDDSVVASSETENIELTEEEKTYVKNKVKTYEDKKIVTTINYLPMEYGGVSITSVHSDLGVKPNTDYEISYVVQFASQEAMNSYKAYDASFSSIIKAKVTQENNPGWNEDGTGENYKPGYEITDGENSSNKNTREVNNNGNTQTETKIYFEVPEEERDSWGNATIRINDSESISNIQEIDSSNKWYLGTTNTQLSKAKIKISGNTPTFLQETDVPNNKKRIIVKTNYASLYIHAFDNSGTSVIGGIQQITNIEKDYGTIKIYSYDVPDSATKVLFLSSPNWGNGNGQTDNATITGLINIYNVESGTVNDLGENELGLSKSLGDLYYFSTKNVFICTNESDYGKGSATINYKLNDTGEVVKTITKKGAIGEECTVDKITIPGYQPPTTTQTITYSETGNSINYIYEKKSNCSVIYYNYNSGEPPSIWAWDKSGDLFDTDYSSQPKMTALKNGWCYVECGRNLDNNLTIRFNKNTNSQYTFTSQYYNNNDLWINNNGSPTKSMKLEDVIP